LIDEIFTSPKVMEKKKLYFMCYIFILSEKLAKLINASLIKYITSGKKLNKNLREIICKIR